MSKRVSQFGKFNQIMHLIDILSTDIEQLQWKNDNNHGFDVTYLKQTLQTMQKQQNARQEAIQSQLTELKVKKQAIRQATQQIHQDLRLKEQQSIQTMHSQFKKCEQDIHTTDMKLQKSIKHTFDKINMKIDDISSRQQKQSAIWQQHLQQMTKDVRQRTIQIEAALKQHSSAYQQSCQLLLNMIQKMYQRHHAGIINLRQWREDQRDKVFDLTELLVKQLKKLCF